jgi:sarcosine oxidase
MESYDVVVVGLGALGSSAAMHLARRGKRVLGLERFELGHRRGASHDSSRILRHSYHTPGYVRLTQEAYADWTALERWSGEQLVTVTGGLDLFPPDPAIAMVDYASSLTDVGIPFELLDVAEIGRRWPQFSLPSGTVGLYQERGAIVPAARTTALMQKLAVAAGAELRGSTQVLALSDSGGQVEVVLEGSRLTADRVVVCTDA